MTRSIATYDRDIGWPGLVAPYNYPFAVASKTLTANLAYVARFTPSRDMTITMITYFVVTSTVAGDAVDVGIYDAGLGTRIVSSGATTSSLHLGNHATSITISTTTLTAGTIYYAAFSCNAAPGLLAATWPSSGGPTLFGLFGTGLQVAGELGGSHPLPSSLSGSSGTTGVPLLAVRES